MATHAGKEFPEVTILAHDAGVANYGYAVLKVQLDRYTTGNPAKSIRISSVRVLEHGKFLSTMRGLTAKSSIKAETRGFVDEVRGVLDRWPSIDVQLAERFMMRTAGGALTIELVNQMLGALRVIALEYGKPIKFLPASQWKNAIKNSKSPVDLTELYAYAKPASDHQMDAALIGLYGSYMIFGLKPFISSRPRMFGEVTKKLAIQISNSHPTHLPQGRIPGAPRRPAAKKTGRPAAKKTARTKLVRQKRGVSAVTRAARESLSERELRALHKAAIREAKRELRAKLKPARKRVAPLRLVEDGTSAQMLSDGNRRFIKAGGQLIALSDAMNQPLSGTVVPGRRNKKLPVVLRSKRKPLRGLGGKR